MIKLACGLTLFSF